MLFDTDVLIWCFRGNEKAAKLIEQCKEQKVVYIVNYMELIQGARSGREKRLIQAFLTDFNFIVLPLTDNIGKRASIYSEQYALKNGIQMADALVAATAIENATQLCTSNRKHYSCIDDLSLKLFKAI